VKVLVQIDIALTIIHGIHNILSSESLFSLIRDHVPYSKTIKLKKQVITRGRAFVGQTFHRS
jgi:hypothetical protein